MRPLFSLPIPETLVTGLAKAGFLTFEDLTANNECSKEALEIINSFGFSWNEIKSYTSDVGSVSAAQRLRNEQFNESIPTFSEALDRILGGGVQTDSILQICGPPGSGKTQLGLQLCVNAQIPISIGGLGAESIFIDTEGTFSINRFKEIAAGVSEHCRNIADMHKITTETNNFTTDFILSGVHYVGTGNLIQFVSGVQRLRELLESNRNIKLIVIDSFTYPFLKVSKTLERTRYISLVLQNLHELIVEYSLAVVLINHLTTKISQENKVLAPSLGESFTHRIPNTLLLGIVENFFSAFMYKSCKFKEEIVHFKITIGGIRDV